MVLATEGPPERRSTLVKKVSGRMGSNTFKRMLPFSFAVIISAFYYCLIHTKALGTKPVSNLKKLYPLLTVMSPCSYDFLLMS